MSSVNLTHLHLYLSHQVLRHRLPAEVEVGVHGVPGQEGGGPRLDHGGPAGAPQELDTGQTHPRLWERETSSSVNNNIYSKDTSTNWE